MSKDLISKVLDSIEGAERGTESYPKQWVSTGNLALNKIISGRFDRGLPFGKVVEIFGDPSTGKSLLLAHLIAEVQKLGGIAILDDTEEAYDQFFGEKIGIVNDDLIRLSSLTVEEHFEKVFIGWKDSKGKEKPSIVDLIQKDDPNCLILVVLDSLALLSTRHEQEVKFEKNDMTKAKLIKASFRMVSGKMRSGNILHAISNHVYYKIGIVYGNPKATPGGTGTPFQASVRLDLTLGKKLKNEDETAVIGVESHVTVAKNRLAPPFGKATIEIGFDRGVDPYSGLLEVLESNGRITDEGNGFYTYGKEKFRRGKFPEFLESHKEILQETPTE